MAQSLSLERAQHSAWMEFGSTVLNDIWGLETALEPELFDARRAALTAKFQRLEALWAPDLTIQMNRP